MTIPFSLAAPSEVFRLTEILPVKVNMAKNYILVHEFDRIFNDLFSSRGEIYKKIIKILSQGMKDRTTLQKTMVYAPSGTLSQHLKALEICGFVSKHPDWSLKTGKPGD